ncbi:MAG TPA: hypothetical protein DCW90_17455, partial [Lachnospiraceae bacterium]|nr:hypothetical protein [Lachnospiraceae bacterium]
MDTNLKLQQALTRLETGDISVSKLEGFLSEPSISNDIKWFLKHIDDETIPIEQIDKLRMILDVAMYIYDVSGADTGISDSDYDKLSEFYQRISKDYHFTPRNPSSSKVPHSYPVLRGTLQKIYSLGKQDISNKVNSHRATLEEWVKQKENYIFSNTGKHVNLFDEFVYVFPKWDGCSCIFEFDEHGNLLRALTRGDVSLNLAQDITHHFKGIRGHDYGVPYGEKTEIMVRDTDLDDYNAKYGKDYKQTRSIASAIINSKDSDERDNLLVRKMLREIRKGEGDIERLCPEVFDDPYIKCQLRDIDKIIDFSIDHQNGFRCDGSVIYFIDQKIQSLLGRHDDRNWFEVAYKFTEEYTYSHVVDMHFQMGPMGRLTPVVEVEPVKLKGNIISRISLGSMARFRALQLSKGDKVKILYDIVPYLDIDKKCNISHEDSFPEPRYCPECGSILHRDGDVVSCQSKDCPWVQKGQIVNYLMKRNVVGISFMTVGTLYDL